MSLQIEVRDLQPEDIARVLEIAKDLNQPADVCEADLQDMFSNANIKPQFFVAVAEGKIMGFIGINDPRIDFGTQVLMWAMVQENMWEKGIGKALVKRVIKTARETPQCYCLILTTPQHAYFEKFGFKIIEKLKNGEHRMSFRF